MRADRGLDLAGRHLGCSTTIARSRWTAGKRGSGSYFAHRGRQPGQRGHRQLGHEDRPRQVERLARGRAPPRRTSPARAGPAPAGRRAPARDTRAPAPRARARVSASATPGGGERRLGHPLGVVDVDAVAAAREPGAGRAEAGQRDAEPQLLVRGPIAVLGPMRREDVADLEEPRVRHLAVRVDREHLEEAGDAARGAAPSARPRAGSAA